MGTDRQQLLKIPVRPRLSRLPHYDMRRHLRRTGKQHDNRGQPAQRDFLPCSLYRYPLLFPVQIRRTCEVNFFSALAENRYAKFAIPVFDQSKLIPFQNGAAFIKLFFLMG